jgi:regulator of protease activity HflC (stomatin/prohibitin superfamily)
MIWILSLLTIVLVIALAATFLEEKSNELRVIVLAIYVALCLLVTFFCCFQRIQPGEVGVIVNLIGSHKGVEDKELNVGYHFIKPWCDVYRFPIYEQNHQWTGPDGFNFQTSEGLSVHADIGITFNLQPDHIHDLFYKYRRGMDEITHLFIRNNIRDAINKAASKMTIEELYGSSKEKFFDIIQGQLREELKPLGFNINHLFIIGQFQVPDNVKAALNAKIEATQRAQQRENELREAEAQARKEVAIVGGVAQSKLIQAQADAQANKLVAQSLTREMLQWEALRKWDGKLPQVVGKDIPFIIQMKND